MGKSLHRGENAAESLQPTYSRTFTVSKFYKNYRGGNLKLFTFQETCISGLWLADTCLGKHRCPLKDKKIMKLSKIIYYLIFQKDVFRQYSWNTPQGLYIYIYNSVYI